jgi:adenylate kinase family enzyme
MDERRSKEGDMSRVVILGIAGGGKSTLARRISATDRWVIDGFGTYASMDRRCDAADTLILLDQPAWRHYWWAYKRNLKLLFRHNDDLPAGCSKWPLWRMMWPIIRQTREHELPRLRKLLADRPDKARYVLRSPREIEAFCRENL